MKQRATVGRVVEGREKDGDESKDAKIWHVVIRYAIW